MPEVSSIVTFQEWLDESNEGLKLVLHHRAETSVADLPSPEGPVTLLIGPEGGLAPAEIEGSILFSEGLQAAIRIGRAAVLI